MGMELAVVTRIVEAHGGISTFESEEGNDSYLQASSDSCVIFCSKINYFFHESALRERIAYVMQHHNWVCLETVLLSDTL